MLTILVSIVVISFLFERWLDYLNSKTWTTSLPFELQGLYDEEKYAKAMQYDKVNSRFENFTATLSFTVTLIMLLMGVFGKWYTYCESFGLSYTLTHFLFFGSLFIFSDLLNLPFQLYQTFNIEQKFGFNQTTLSTFFADKIKGYLLGIMIGGPLMAAFIYFYQYSGPNFWIYAWVVISGFSLLMAAFYSSLILPLFNKLQPLAHGDLRTAIENYCNKAGFKISNLMVMDGSKRSAKANAFFTGLGQSKKIVLFDTLINQHTQEELVAVLAHEVGHYKHRHILVSMIISVLQMGVLLYIFSLFVNEPAISVAMGGNKPVLALGILGFGILYSPLSLITSLVMNFISRKNEYEADAFAAKTYSAEPLMNALKKLSVNHLSNLTPHAAYVFFNYSHPTLLQRIRALIKLSKR
nr:M48 family metallopeptidase [Bacteroidota bacterium]